MKKKTKKETNFMSKQSVFKSFPKHLKEHQLGICYVCQRIFSVLFILNVIMVALYTLWFMTDFMGLRGFVLGGKVGSAFYLQLQPFNQTLFYFALVGVISILFIKVFDFTKNVVDLFPLILISIIGILLIISSFYAFTYLPLYQAKYLKVITPEVIKAMNMENSSNYVVNIRAFNYGTIVYVINIVIVALFMIFSWVTTILFKSSENQKKLKKETLQSEVPLNE